MLSSVAVMLLIYFQFIKFLDILRYHRGHYYFECFKDLNVILVAA